MRLLVMHHIMLTHHALCIVTHAHSQGAHAVQTGPAHLSVTMHVCIDPLVIT